MRYRDIFKILTPNNYLFQIFTYFLGVNNDR